jgi:hypothetical protein
LVAIKKSWLVDKKQLKDLSKEFLILSQINHMNVVKLLGYSCLNRYIHGDGGQNRGAHAGRGSALPSRRTRAAARSLAYMHSGGPAGPAARSSTET